MDSDSGEVIQWKIECMVILLYTVAVTRSVLRKLSSKIHYTAGTCHAVSYDYCAYDFSFKLYLCNVIFSRSTFAFDANEFNWCDITLNIGQGNFGGVAGDTQGPPN